MLVSQFARAVRVMLQLNNGEAGVFVVYCQKWLNLNLVEAWLLKPLPLLNHFTIPYFFSLFHNARGIYS